MDSAASATEMDLGEEATRDVTVAAHFAFGAACGALLGSINPRASLSAGAAAGTAVWLGSYFGWLPAAGILKPASDHPARRNALMIGVHLVWGATTAAAMRELCAVRETMISAGPDRDAPPRTGVES